MSHLIHRVGLAICYAAIGAPGAAIAQSLPPGYSAPAPMTDRGKAPAMQVRQVSQAPDGSRTYAITFGKGDHVISGLTEWAEREGITGGHLTAIGALSSAHLAWFDKEVKAYKDIPVDEQSECLGFTGDIGMVDGKPALHVHGVVGLPDGSVRGGHVVEAVTWPTLEVFVTATPNALIKEKDAESGLDLFDLSQ